MNKLLNNIQIKQIKIVKYLLKKFIKIVIKVKIQFKNKLIF